MIHPKAEIHPSVVIIQSETSNIGNCKIGVGTKVHSHAWIGDGVVIGERCRIQAFAYIPPGVTIGDDVFIGPRVTFTNDKYPPSTELLPTVVEERVSIGAGAIILPGLTLWAHCRVGAGAVVTKSVPPGVLVMGNPAREK